MSGSALASLSHAGRIFRRFQAPQSAWNWIMTFAWRCPHTGESYFDPTNAVGSGRPDRPDRYGWLSATELSVIHSNIYIYIYICRICKSGWVGKGPKAE